ncbi:hypothetical protein C8F01DRAFT_1255628 [Mycena amicta]|nr:hypothetical protein C8F01DRAFT_1255628 [Mycena amicta]
MSPDHPLPEPLIAPPAFLHLIHNTMPNTGEVIDSDCNAPERSADVASPLASAFDFHWPPPPAHDPPPRVIAAWEESQLKKARSTGALPFSQAVQPAHLDKKPVASGKTKMTRGWKSLRRVVSGIFQRPKIPPSPTSVQMRVAAADENSPLAAGALTVSKRQQALSITSTKSSRLRTRSHRRSQRDIHRPPVPVLPAFGLSTIRRRGKARQRIHSFSGFVPEAGSPRTE